MNSYLRFCLSACLYGPDRPAYLPLIAIASMTSSTKFRGLAEILVPRTHLSFPGPHLRNSSRGWYGLPGRSDSDIVLAYAGCTIGRPSHQRWVYYNAEAPFYRPVPQEYDGLFNWTMTLRTDSDIVLAYAGCTIMQRHLSIDQFLRSMMGYLIGL